MTSKDSTAVVQFLTTFNQLKEWIDHDLVGLVELASNDKSIRDLCLKLHCSAFILSRAERAERHLFSKPVDPSFIKAWRDYEDRFADILDDIFLLDFGLENLLDPIGGKERADMLWNNADSRAGEQALAIETALDYAFEAVTDDDRFEEEFTNQIEDAYNAWSDLKQKIGFNLRDVFRRRELVPFILVPRQVSKDYGQSEKLSLFSQLAQAHDAFVLGVPFAAIALMRSVLENVLKDHYSATGSDLEQRINSVRTWPGKARKERFHALRRLANDILHSNKERVKIPADFERELLSYLFALRALIEGAPNYRS